MNRNTIAFLLAFVYKKIKLLLFVIIRNIFSDNNCIGEVGGKSLGESLSKLILLKELDLFLKY